jgi:hypothetical protein
MDAGVFTQLPGKKAPDVNILAFLKGCADLTLSRSVVVSLGKLTG